MLPARLAVLCRAVEGPHRPEQVGVKRAEEINSRQRDNFKVNKMRYTFTQSLFKLQILWYGIPGCFAQIQKSA